MNKQCVNCPGAVDHSTAECPLRATAPVGVPDDDGLAPGYGDGHDWEGFPGGCARLGCSEGCSAAPAAPTVKAEQVSAAARDVIAERQRQINIEDWTPAHDDLYCAAELPRAAAAYILNGANDDAPYIWPFAAKWWKPKDARANYVRAAALILAEIERLDRAEQAKQQEVQL